MGLRPQKWNSLAEGSPISQRHIRSLIVSTVAKLPSSRGRGSSSTTGALGTWLAPAFGKELRLGFDGDAVEALAADRDALWKRVGGADFLTDDEKRAAVGYGPKEGAAGG